jgi:hypothetical protein
MTAIDCTDCYLAIEIGDGLKRALVRHFGRFIAAELATHRIAAAGDGADESIDRDAWRLAAKVLAEVEDDVAGTLDESLLAADPQKAAQEILAAVVALSVAATERDFLADDELGFAALAARIAPALS